jgi:molybdopterin/thiamine biosynthesis adenylyltransferase
MSDVAQHPSYDEIFARQIIIEEIGERGQRKLAESSVLVIGCGGLGSAVITYLASAGIGTIIIADGDTVSASNLNRQFIHAIDDIGRGKAKSAAEKASRINGASRVIAVERNLTGEDLYRQIASVDCVIDCVDSYLVRTEVGRASLRADVPLVEAGVADWYGWMLPVNRKHACLECAGLRGVEHLNAPPVLGAVVGMIGSMQALEAIKILLGLPYVGYGVLHSFDGGLMEVDRITLEIDPDCPAHRSMLDTL